MTKHSRRKFERELQKLFKARTYKMMSSSWPSKGAAPKLTRVRVRNSITTLQSIAEEEYLSSREGKEFLTGYDNKKRWHPKRGKGWGRPAKKQAFKAWYENNITTKHCVYVFWNNRKCLYIGRTLNGKSRPLNHFDKYWFGQVTRIDIYGFKGKRDVPRFECLISHKFYPTKAKNTPSSKRYSSNCPICNNSAFIKEEIQAMFRFRKRRRRS